MAHCQCLHSKSTMGSSPRFCHGHIERILACRWTELISIPISWCFCQQIWSLPLLALKQIFVSHSVNGTLLLPLQGFTADLDHLFIFHHLLLSHKEQEHRLMMKDTRMFQYFPDASLYRKSKEYLNMRVHVISSDIPHTADSRMQGCDYSISLT